MEKPVFPISGCPKLLVVMWFCLLGSPLLAQDGFEREFTTWAAQNDMHSAALFALNANGTAMAQFGDAVDTPRPIASISKTVAGQCALYMARQGLLSLEDPVGDVLGWSGPQGNVTAAQLLTHTSGFGPDSTQSDILGRNLTRKARIARIIEKVSKRPPLPVSNATYSYNNENFLILDALLSRILSEDAVGWCLRSVPALSALGSLGASDATHALGLAGGLEMSARDLAYFFHGLTAETDWPKVPIGGLNSYGPGVILQSTQDGENYFHVGGICVFLGVEFGAFAARLANGNSVAVVYSGCADDAALRQLNGLILTHLLRRS